MLTKYNIYILMEDTKQKYNMMLENATNTMVQGDITKYNMMLQNIDEL